MNRSIVLAAAALLVLSLMPAPSANGGVRRIIIAEHYGDCC
jgi:hypothetical protein